MCAKTVQHGSKRKTQGDEQRDEAIFKNAGVVVAGNGMGKNDLTWIDLSVDESDRDGHQKRPGRVLDIPGWFAGAYLEI